MKHFQLSEKQENGEKKLNSKKNAVWATEKIKFSENKSQCVGVSHVDVTLM